MDFSATNYSVKYREYAVKNIRPNLSTGDRGNFDTFIDSLSSAIHFQLPDRGNLLVRDEKKGPKIAPTELRPPFPETVIEFSASGEAEGITVKSSKRLVLATTTFNCGFPNVTLIPVMYLDDGRLWTAPYFAFVFPTSPTAPDVPLVKYGCGGAGFAAMPLLPDLCQKLVGQIGQDGLISMMTADYADEINAYVDMVLALGCRNVGTVDVGAAPALNAARKKRGEPPLFDYKVLTVGNVRSPRMAESDGYPEGAISRRAHLRRGHIRRLPTGKRTWVNAAFVSGTGGFSHKSYNLLPMAANLNGDMKNAR